LGPVDVAMGEAVKAISGSRRKAVLAALGLHPGQVVGADRLIDLVWDDRPPVTAPNALQSHISYLRRIFEDRGAIVARPPGYVMHLGPETTDVQVAERLIRQAKETAEPERAAAGLRAALSLWRGPALADAATSAWLTEQRERLTAMWLDATLALAQVRLKLGEHEELVAELEQLAAEHPWNEQVCQQLMLALYRTGRQVDALAAYQRLRHSLDEELAILPSPALRELEVAILRQDDSLSPAAATPSGPVPAQLPVAVHGFAGRQAELERLDALSRQSPPPVVVVSGTAGVGKTSLAVHWGHRAAERFPDGQLYVNLRGFHPSGSVMSPAQALRGFLEAYGVPAQRIPAGLDAQAALYRSVMRGKRALVVLDNARDAEQVRPLLPASPGCLVVATSRNQLTALVTAEGASPLALGLLTDREAGELLVGRLGQQRVAAEPEAVGEVIARCARLPLALAVAAATCVTNPGFSVSAVAVQLRDSAAMLAAVSGADAGSDVRAVFSWSYQTLSPSAARLFRLLGLHPGPDLSVQAAAGLCGLSLAKVRPLLAELTHAHLLMRPAPERYAFHDLLRSYAADLTASEEDEQQRQSASLRLFDHYLHTAMGAARQLNPQREPIALAAPALGAAHAKVADHAGAVAWFTAERAVLLAVLRQSAQLRFDTHTWQLAWAMQDHLTREGYWAEQAGNQQAAVEAGERLGDPLVQAGAFCALATACARQLRFEEADGNLSQAAELFGKLDHHAGQANAQFQMGWVANRLGEPRRALGHARHALRLYRRAGDALGAARALNSLGWDHALCGDYARALPRCEQALAQLHRLGDRHHEAAACDSVGFIHHHLGNYESAAVHYTRALELFRGIGDRYFEADTLNHLGDTHCAMAQKAAARTVWRQALDIFERLTHPDAEQVRAKLDALGPT
jgi:DNA-binding SARP family transcriptional activator